MPINSLRSLFLMSMVVLSVACRSENKNVAGASAESTDVDNSQDKIAKTRADRLRIMSYNVLRYGCGCQADNTTLHNYLKTIVKFSNPDVVGLVKVDAIKHAANDAEGDAPVGFADSILNNAMNAALPARFAVCPFTNKSAANNTNLLFYNPQKLGFAGMETLVADETDFNLYKLYLKNSVNGKSHDTSFIYFLLNHTESGDKSKDRDRQMSEVSAALHKRFNTLPNIVDMGDFNLRNTNEPGYQTLVSKDGFADPPFHLDNALSYPADWETDPDKYASYLTTSTRKKDDKPNECGTGGGGKFWFDHIFLSPSIAAGKGNFKYVPHSFHVIGNDGDRVGRSVNADKHPNKSVPQNVADALFEFSNKYPVVLELETRN